MVYLSLCDKEEKPLFGGHVIMIFEGKNVFVVGTGISGIGAAKLLVQEHANVVLFDGNEKLKADDIRTKVGVISPGVPIDSGLVLNFKAAGVPVWGEIELAYHFDKGTLLAITGTNGKTTTTALTGQIMKAYNESTFVVGNIGNPYTTEVSKTSEGSHTVAEISSFQLETIHEFKPLVSAILNITPDHLNRHHTMECYIQTKENICLNQTKSETCVLNYEDEVLRDFGLNRCNADVVWFSSKCRPPKGAYVEGENIHYFDGNEDHVMMNVHDMNLIGTHNYENVCAAIDITKAAGVPEDIILHEIKRFKAVEHRIEYVATKNDVVYYNDSKGTNPDAAIKAIKAMSRPTILIGGGYDKGSEFDDYVKAFSPNVKMLVLMGVTAPKIAATAEKYGFTNVVTAGSLEEVVKICADNAKPGDAVLLSPACASWDMFESYEQRGRMFKDYVNRL
jgi:UDP-N-acetylmuramoylalanine--D-glutamate ligase